WYGMVAPRDIPAPVAETLHAALVQTLNMPEVKDKLAQQGALPGGDSSAAFHAFLVAEIEKWAKVVKQANIKPE
ncbi:MAG: hypothetical protein B7Y70_13920, partial [Rhizobiales bacterium 35-68-8]